MSETGVVVRIEGDQALIEMEASKECEACGACRYSREGRMIATVQNRLSASVGDTVQIEIEPKTVVVAALIVYILPILMFFLGYAIGLLIGNALGASPDMIGLVGGAIFLAISYITVKIIDKRARISRRFEPTMCDISRDGQQ